MANADSTPSGTPDDHMTSVDGIRVRKDEEKAFRARHKAVLAPEGGAVSTRTTKAKSARGKAQAESGDDTDD